MGRCGPKSSAPGGYGSVTKAGYRRMWIAKEKKMRLEHVLVWEKHRGRVPSGMSVHHKNRKRLDNRIANLELVSFLYHKRIHSGCMLRSGRWFKPCCKCDKMQPIENYYKRVVGISPWCKKCCVENAVMNKRKRAAKRKGRS